MPFSNPPASTPTISQQVLHAWPNMHPCTAHGALAHPHPLHTPNLLRPSQSCCLGCNGKDALLSHQQASARSHRHTPHVPSLLAATPARAQAVQACPGVEHAPSPPILRHKRGLSPPPSTPTVHQPMPYLLHPASAVLGPVHSAAQPAAESKPVMACHCNGNTTP